MKRNNTSGSKGKKSRRKSGVVHNETTMLKIKGTSIYKVIREKLKVIDDPARASKPDFKYKLSDLAMTMIIAMVAGHNKISAICEFLNQKKDLLSALGLFTNEEAKGDFPCDSHVYRMVKRIDGVIFGAALLSFTQKLALVEGKKGFVVLAVDGKRLRRTSCGERNIPLNVLTAVIADLKVPLASVTCDEKSNEITAWDKLLDILKDKVANAVFTADAMGCQVKIAETICKELNCFYCLAVKDNQENLHDDVKELVKRFKPVTTFTEKPDKNGGREEWRKVEVFPAYGKEGGSWICDAERWKDLKYVIKVTSTRTVLKKKTSKKTVDKTGYNYSEVGEKPHTSKVVRYYISNAEVSAKEFNTIIRSHWHCESYHWHMDTAFEQDKIQRNNDKDSSASTNFDLLQKFAYSILRLYDVTKLKTDKDYKHKSMPRLRVFASANQDCMLEVLSLDMNQILEAC